MSLTEWTPQRFRRLTVVGLSLAVLSVPAAAAPALATTAAPATQTAPTTQTAPAAAAVPAAPGSATLTAAAVARARAKGSGWLRLAHLSPNTPPVDVYLYSFGNP